MHVDLFDFDLPDDRIALRPARPRDSARLLVVEPDGQLQDRRARDLPGLLRAGDALYSVAHFDNSHYNPNNPDPEATVRFGLQSEQEMFNLRVKFERVKSDE